MNVRIAKFIADSGFASRRDAERLIESGVVTVNGQKITTPVFFVDGSEDIRVNNSRLQTTHSTLVYAFHKPINTMTTTRDPLGRKTIYDILGPEYKNLKYIGRLDFKTTGLLLMTNDGDLARKLTLPSSNISRVYIAVVRGNDFSNLDIARNGITVDGIKYRPMQIDVLPDGQLRVTVVEGKKNEIRIVLGAIGLPVLGLHRISYGPVKLGNIPVGQIHQLSQKTIDLLAKSF